MSGGQERAVERRLYDQSTKYRYRLVYETAHGPLTACDNCGVNSDSATLVIHHKDLNHYNDDPANLVGLCQACHAQLHHSGAIRSEETRIAISEGLAKYHKSVDPSIIAERSKRVGATMRERGSMRKPKHPEFGSLQSSAQYTSRWRVCVDCGLETNAGAMGRHTKKTGHNVRS